MGPLGERRYGARHFIELSSAFTADPVLSVRQGRYDVGQVPDVAVQAAYAQLGSGPVLLLAGRAWLIRHVDWRRRVVHVEPAEGQARVRFPSGAVPLGYELCQAIAAVVAGADPPVALTQRAAAGLAELRAELPRCGQAAPSSNAEPMAPRGWWTFAGLRANVELAARLAGLRDHMTQRDNLSITLSSDTTVEDVRAALDQEASPAQVLALISHVGSGLKLSECLPDTIADEVIVARFRDEQAVTAATGAAIYQHYPPPNVDDS